MKSFQEKLKKREKSRLVKAEKSALVDRRIEEELLTRLKTGVYDEIENYPHKIWQQTMEKNANSEEKEKELEYDSEDIDNVFVGEVYGENIENDDEEDNEDNENDQEDNEDKYSNNTNSTKFTKGKEFMAKKRTRPTFDKKGKKKFNFEDETENTKTKNKQSLEDYNNW